MSEEQEKRVPRFKFPIITKIAIGWLFLAPIVGIPIYVLCYSSDISGSLFPQLYFIGIFIALFLFCLPAILLLVPRRWCWDIAVFLLSTYIMGILIYCIMSYRWFIQFWGVDSVRDNVIVYSSCCGGALLPLILVLLDRKNYFKMIHEKALARAEEEDDQ
jgi:hypothetical protein